MAVINLARVGKGENTSRVEKWLSLIWLELEKGREDIRHLGQNHSLESPRHSLILVSIYPTATHVDDTHCTIFPFGCT